MLRDRTGGTLIRTEPDKRIKFGENPGFRSKAERYITEKKHNPQAYWW
jgi:hypothetical protein